MAQNSDLSLYLRLKATAKQWISEVKAAAKAVKDDLGESLKDAEQDATKADTTFSKFFTRAKLGALGVAVAVASLSKKTADAGRNVDELRANLEIADGSAQAAAATFERLQQASIDWKVGVEQLVDAYVRLKNLGLDPSRESLESYLNIAAGNRGKELIDFAEAVADATVGEFERLKEFGIKAGIEGDKIVLRFKGQTVEISNSAKAIEQALQRIGETEFAGALARKAQTANAGFSGLVDSLTRLLTKLDEKSGLTASLAAVANGLGKIVDTATASKDALEGVKAAVDDLSFAEQIEQFFDRLDDRYRALRGLDPVDFKGETDELARRNRLEAGRVDLLEQQAGLLVKIREASLGTYFGDGARQRALQFFGSELTKVNDKLADVERGLAQMGKTAEKAGNTGAVGIAAMGEAAGLTGDALKKALADSADALGDYVKETEDMLTGFDEIARRYGSAGDDASLHDFWRAEGEAATNFRRGNYDAAWKAVERAREEFEQLAKSGKISQTEVDILARSLKDLAQDIAKGRAEAGSLFKADDTLDEVERIKTALNEFKKIGVDIDTGPVEAAIARLTGNPIIIPVIFQPQGGAGAITGGGRSVGLNPGEYVPNPGDGLVEGTDYGQLGYVDPIQRASRAVGGRAP